MKMIDAEDVGKLACATVVQPRIYNKHEIDLGSESLTPDEIVRQLSLSSGKKISLELYLQEEAVALAAKNLTVHGQL